MEIASAEQATASEAVRYTKLRQAVQLALDRSLSPANEQAFAQCFAALAPELSPATISQIRRQFLEQLSQNVQVCRLDCVSIAILQLMSDTRSLVYRLAIPSASLIPFVENKTSPKL